MSKYNQYNNYLPADIWHLRRKPAHWNTAQLKRVVDGCVNGIWGAEPDGKDDMVVVRVADFDRDRLSIKDSGYTFRKVSEAERLRRQLNRGDLLLEKSGGGEKTLVGQVVLFDGGFDAVTSNFVAKMSPKPTHDSRFLNYVFARFYNERINYCSIKQNTGIQNLDSDQYLSEHFVFPCLIEQKKIAAFLDHETAKIDTLIEKQQQLIKLLKEKRQAVISHAVTKGLNSDAPMKDSGVEWLGEVPEHWKVCNMGHVLNAIGDLDHYMPQSTDDGIPYVMTGDLEEFSSNINFEDCKKVSYRDYLQLSKKIKTSKGDIIMARYATIGTASYVDIDREFLVSYSCVTIKPNKYMAIGIYLFYYLSSFSFMQGVQSKINTSTQGNVGTNDIKKVKIALPGLEEQKRIIDYLKDKIYKIECLSNSAEKAVSLMCERRAAIISAAVTGKIDVRSWAPQTSADMQQETTPETVATPATH